MSDYISELSKSGFCKPARVRNSTGSYTACVKSGATLTLPEETHRVYVNNVLQQTFTLPPYSNSNVYITN